VNRAEIGVVLSFKVLRRNASPVYQPQRNNATHKAGVPDAALRWTVNRFAPGPLIVRFLLINNSALVGVTALFEEERSFAKGKIQPHSTAFRGVQERADDYGSKRTR
jgi:hypothetical protein